MVERHRTMHRRAGASSRASRPTIVRFETPDDSTSQPTPVGLRPVGLRYLIARLGAQLIDSKASATARGE
jgi:hypothetical protein